MRDLYSYVTKSKYGYYELKQKVDKEVTEKFYKDSYYQTEKSLYRKKYTDSEIAEKNRSLIEKRYMIENYISKTDRGNRLLDIGCGEGFALKYFMEQGYDVTGIEFSLHGCKYHNPEIVKKIISGDVFSVLDQFDGYIGTILLDHVLEHIMQPEDLIRKITTISKKGTCLIISVPNDFSETQKRLWEKEYIDIPFWVTTSYPPEHLSYFNKDALKNLLEEYGWRMEAITGSFPIDFNLFNENTNYIKDKIKGKSCHKAALEIEELLYSVMKIGDIMDIYRKLGEAGLGRSITTYFIRI